MQQLGRRSAAAATAPPTIGGRAGKAQDHHQNVPPVCKPVHLRGAGETQFSSARRAQRCPLTSTQWELCRRVPPKQRSERHRGGLLLLRRLAGPRSPLSLVYGGGSRWEGSNLQRSRAAWHPAFTTLCCCSGRLAARLRSSRAWLVLGGVPVLAPCPVQGMLGRNGFRIEFLAGLACRVVLASPEPAAQQGASAHQSSRFGSQFPNWRFKRSGRVKGFSGTEACAFTVLLLLLHAAAPQLHCLPLGGDVHLAPAGVARASAARC